MCNWQFVLIIFLLFEVCLGRPAKYQGQLNNIINETAVIDDCLFTNFDQQLPDEFPAESRTKMECGDNIFSLGKILTHIKVDNNKLFGAKNIVDLLLTRMGNFQVKWNGDEEDVLLYNICERHFVELYWRWEFYHTKQKPTRGASVLACDYPDEINSHKGDRRLSNYRISKNDAELFYKKHKKFLHPGIGMCKDHQHEIVQMVEEYTEMQLDTDFCPASEDNVCPDTDIPDNDFDMDIPGCNNGGESQPTPRRSPKDVATSAAVKAFALKFDIDRLVTPGCNYESLSPRSKQNKINSVKFLLTKIAESAAPDNEKPFLTKVCKAFQPNIESEWKVKLLKNVASQHEKALDDKYLRLIALSTITHLVPYAQLLQYIPDLSQHFYYEARKLQRAPEFPVLEEKQKYIRYDQQKIETFVDFFTSPFCLVTLPYGLKKVKLSDGSKLDIPHTMRMQRHAEILRMYKTKMEEVGKKDLILPDSTMFAILQQCYAKQVKSLACVDYFIAGGIEAFENLAGIVDDWTTNQLIDAETAKGLKKELSKANQFLRSDFRVNLEMESQTIDQCMTFALSDANDKAFRQACSIENQHITISERGNALDNIMNTMQNYAEEFIQNLKDDMVEEIEERKRTQYQINEYIADVREMQKHVLRSRFSDIQRTKIIEDLPEGGVFITLDWAQKLLPSKRMETQKTYFGKKGMSYHITHCLTKIDNKAVDHTFVHIVEETKQDNIAVNSILIDVLHNVSRMGIVSAVLRADNAACYHNTQLIFSLKEIPKITGVNIKRFSFSEAQNGKSSCDQKASHLKNKVRDCVIFRHKVETEDEFFRALTSPAIAHTTVSKTSVHPPATIQKAKAIPGISFISEFIFEENGIRLFKFMGIGPGKFLSYDDYKPVTNLPLMHLKLVYNVLNGNGAAERTITAATEKAALVAKEKTFFWKVINGTRIKRQGQQFYCPENQCVEHFDSMSELEAHLQMGKHTLKPERLTAMDYAVTYFRYNVLAAGSLDPFEQTIRNNVMNDLIRTNLREYFQGWAQKTARDLPKITVAGKEFLRKIFNDGERTGVKTSPTKAAKQMAKVKQNGEFLFAADEVMKSSQILSYFSFLSKEKKRCDDPENYPPPAKKRRCPLPEPENDEFDEAEEEIDDEQPEDQIDVNLRRSQRIRNIENSRLKQQQQQNVEEMLEDFIDE